MKQGKPGSRSETVMASRFGAALCVFGAIGCGEAGGSNGAIADHAPAVVIGDASSDTRYQDYGDTMPHPTVEFDTSLGDFRVELFPEKAPTSVRNFLSYVDAGFYEGLVFHRVVPGFVVQAGGFGPDMAAREVTGDAIQNESDNGLMNLRGTLSMARLPAPHSAKSQFFISLRDNPSLDHKGGPAGWGYAVFGRVIEGMDVVDAMAEVPTGRVAGHRDVPLEPIVIRKAERGDDIEPGAEPGAAEPAPGGSGH